MTGRAVDTTRLSSEAMNRARPVTTIAHTARDLASGLRGVPDPGGPAAPPSPGAGPVAAGGAGPGGDAGTAGAVGAEVTAREADPDPVVSAGPAERRAARMAVRRDHPGPPFRTVLTVRHVVDCDCSLATWGKKSGMVRG